MTKIKYIISTIIVVIVVGLSILALCQGRANRQLTRQVNSQQVIIDSLLARRMRVFDVKLYVTDRSVNKIYGRYNKGTIQMPSVKTYTLDVDSSNIK